MRTMKRCLILAIVPLLAGCGVTVNNMTPRAMTRNSSGLYPITVEIIRNDNSVIDGTVQPMLVLPDQTVPMIAAPRMSNCWEYTVAVPANVNQWPYYFRINYEIEKALFSRTPGSQIDPANAPAYKYVLRITDRTAVGLDARRGRVGSEIKVLGRGFRQGDQVVFAGRLVPTRYEDDTTLSFQVPSIPANKIYPVEVRSGTSTLKFGDLLIDQSNFMTSASETQIAFDGNAAIDILLPQAAPAGGLPVSLEISDPSLLDLPARVTVPAGQTRLQVTARAKHLGSGSITVAADGFSRGTIPFRIVLVKGGK